VSLFAHHHHHHHHHHHLSLSLSTMSLDSFFGCKDTSRKHTIKSERVPSFPLFEVVSSRFFCALSLSLSFSLSRNNNSTTRKGFRRRKRRTRRTRRRESSSKKWRESEILFIEECKELDLLFTFIALLSERSMHPPSQEEELEKNTPLPRGGAPLRVLFFSLFFEERMVVDEKKRL